ncbi:hypothetical protein L3X38_041003 [Prunus dulcis]|uniref:HAT C-terminal dimerisation domain-containing protein n=1 Tax=Prunus dulcis TaxID=3755 RepID=A0AAD4YJZ8_PRUDU|nr:hypothetical protein L3X38_041003 [Prunus dulcis]
MASGLEVEKVLVDMAMYANSQDVDDIMNDCIKVVEESEAAVVAHEVNTYLHDPLELTTKEVFFDILLWWKLNGPKYPVLAAIVKDILTIQVSTVAYESCFSTGEKKHRGNADQNAADLDDNGGDFNTKQAHENTNFDLITAAAPDQSAANGCKIKVCENKKKTTTKNGANGDLETETHVIRGGESWGLDLGLGPRFHIGPQFLL